MDFNGSSSETLFDRPANVGTGKWIAPPVWKADGSIQGSHESSASAFFPIQILPHKIYRIVAHIEMKSPEGQNEEELGWLAFGLSSYAYVKEPYWKSTLKNPSFVILTQKNSITYHLPSEKKETFIRPVVRSCKTEGPFLIRIDLDTRPEKWGITYYYNQDEIASEELSPTFNVQYVGFGAFNQISARLTQIEITSRPE